MKNTAHTQHENEDLRREKLVQFIKYCLVGVFEYRRNILRDIFLQIVLRLEPLCVQHFGLYRRSHQLVSVQ